MQYIIHYSIYAFFGGVCLLGLVLLIPALHGVFSVADVSGMHLLVIVGLAFLPTLIIQIIKMVREALTEKTGSDRG